MSLTKDISTGTSPWGKGLGGMLSHICTAEHSWRGRQGPPAHSVIRKPGITKLQIKIKIKILALIRFSCGHMKNSAPKSVLGEFVNLVEPPPNPAGVQVFVSRRVAIFATRNS